MGLHLDLALLWGAGGPPQPQPHPDAHSEGREGEGDDHTRVGGCRARSLVASHATPASHTHIDPEVTDTGRAKPLSSEVTQQSMSNTEGDTGTLRGHEGPSGEVWPPARSEPRGLSSCKPTLPSRLHSPQSRVTASSCYSDPIVRGPQPPGPSAWRSEVELML